MPFLVPLIPALIGVATTGITTGLSLSNRPSAPQAAAPVTPGPTPQGPTVDASQKAQASSISSNVQAQTGGSVGPDYLASVLNTAFQGNPQATGNWQQAINQIFGLGAPGSTGTGGGLTSNAAAPSPTTGGTGNSITDILNRVASPSGGGAPGSPVVQSELNQEFRGFA